MRFRRKAAPEPVDAEETGAAVDDVAEPSRGPWDVDQLDDDDEQPRVDLGSLLIPARPGLELRLQVDQATQIVQSVLLVGPDGGMELRAFAAARGGDLWSEVRPQIAADVAQRGGTASEQEGPWGTELTVRVPVQGPDGRSGVQPTRMIGINGPRWLLRASLLGRPAMEPELAEPWEQALSGVVVRRGTEAMPPGDALPLKMPPQAQLTDQER